MTSMCVVGIDPGVTGGIAVLSIDCDRVIEAMPMPTLTDKHGKNLIDAYRVCSILRAHVPQRVYLEQVNAMPPRGKNGESRTMGATSAFNFGRGFGALEAAITCALCPVEYVTPQSWKKRAGLIGTEKDFARTAAIRIFPHAADLLRRKKDIGLADAILIARFGAKAA